MEVLSVFIDESGDFGSFHEKTAYYLVTLVFHNQSIDISGQIEKLEQSMHESGFHVEYIHTGPLIRREEVFSGQTIDDRRKLIYKMLNFVNKCPIFYETISINRAQAMDKVTLSGKIAKEISSILNCHQMFFHSFDKIIVYYDNGQIELSSILNAVFSVHFSQVEFRKAEPQNYRLLQAADFICTMELLKIKQKENRLSQSEKQFFYKPQELRKTFFKSIDKKELPAK